MSYEDKIRGSASVFLFGSGIMKQEEYLVKVFITLLHKCSHSKATNVLLLMDYVKKTSIGTFLHQIY
ncbi:hypothetical protein Plhal304r1_c010g0038881 [Plasmopara halstedii]